MLSEYQEHLPPPASTPEAVFDILWSTAKEIWPQDMAKAEAWVKSQAIRYGIAEAKGTAVAISQSFITWVIGGVILGWVLTRQR